MSIMKENMLFLCVTGKCTLLIAFETAQIREFKIEINNINVANQPSNSFIPRLVKI
jgi:hypothetical protein